MKSTYHKGGPPIQPLTLPNHWPKVWKLKCPFKCKVFLCNLLHAILPTTSNLLRKIPFFDPTCCCCGLYLETRLHIFCDCFHASILWKRIFVAFPPSTDFDLKEFFNSDWDD